MKYRSLVAIRGFFTLQGPKPSGFNYYGNIIFIDFDFKKLQSFAEVLKSKGYDFVDIFKAEMEEGSNVQEYYLQVEKVEKHNVNSLMRRNNEFYELAITQKGMFYDGFDTWKP
ncbi:ribonuclease E inhibitor RraB [Fulvivirga ulvae]|uniref:ribonuclease E inhibitor RraB n=1 Tax=Fulvivirga ulvae TaxID=2904245 RepID=UPI001F3D8C6A|nr:ribonuclease E inhibitor RraB [Fulvivirga ulvae]UII34896.1 ribonuclease E inhibitor RraB [Fulvivirga ulvae]